jgi:apolipoprotein N-acyltransferase
MVASLAGLLFSASFEPLGLWFLAPLAYALFLKFSLRGKNFYRDSFIFGFVGSAITLLWAGKYVGLLPLFFLALLHGLFLLPLGFLGRFTRNILWFIPAILLLEELRSHFPFGGFSWMRIAFSQADAPYASVISIGGALLLSAWVLALSALIVNYYRINLFVIAIALSLPLLISNSYSGDESISFVGVQGNTPSVGLTFNDRAEAVFNLHLEKTRQTSLNGADLIIWPENAIDVDPFLNTRISGSIESLTSDLKVPLIAGAITRKNGPLENISLMYNKSGEVVSLYSKQYLTPFGEFIPLRPLARIVSPYVDGVSDFSPGSQIDNHVVDSMTLAPVICYELLSDSLVQRASAGSDALVVQTNSATFAGTAESAQQLNITRLRAQENAREIASVSTIGISAHIDINGRVISQTDEDVSATLRGDLRSNSSTTFANKLGGLAPALVLVISLIWPVTRRIVSSR